MALLRRDHSEIVPSLRIVWLELDRLLEILSCLLKVILAQIESAQIVVGICAPRLGGDYLLKGLGGLVEIAMLEHRYAVGEVVAQECVLHKHSAERQRFQHAVSCCNGNGGYIASQPICIEGTLIDLDDHAFAI